MSLEESTTSIYLQPQSPSLISNETKDNLWMAVYGTELIVFVLFAGTIGLSAYTTYKVAELILTYLKK